MKIVVACHLQMIATTRLYNCFGVFSMFLPRGKLLPNLPFSQTDILNGCAILEFATGLLLMSSHELMPGRVWCP